MSPTIPEIGVIVTLLINMGVGVWWASKITAKMDTNKDTLIRIERDIDKREARVDAAWRKIDTHEHRLTVVETKCKIQAPQEDL
jgi:predicted  nucleic acid-binding Zn-ribbon protein